ncbi:hypothetical protein [Helicobacter sp. UBA3407]|uniref:hypothetical protein n=1 Tax=Helicobacter sp. UBA3407 TaxID=1946588 RepID=UPI002615D7FA|nr:hypothetical protein [Helicobacter sp. UBA3407]
MVFTSFVFLFAFLPLMLLGFYVLRFYQQDFLAKVFLILGSLFFYGFWNPSYLVLLLGSIGVNFLIGKIILNANKFLLSSSLNLSGGGGQNSLYLESSPFNPNCTFSSTPKQIFKNPKPYLILGILFNLAFLGFFKYADFFLENFNLFAQLLEFDFAIPLLFNKLLFWWIVIKK